MKHLFKPESLNRIWTVLLILLIVKLAWFVVSLIWLPVHGVDYMEQKGVRALYYRVKLSVKKPMLSQTKKTKVMGSIKDIKLLAVYHTSDTTVVTIEHKGKTKVLGRGDVINGFTLHGGGRTYATFRKDGKIYKVSLALKMKVNGGVQVHAAQPRVAKTAPKAVEGEIIDAGDHKIIEKSLLTHYANDMDDIYKNIGIREIKKNGKVQGFSVSSIRRGSPFAQLGLRRGDVIKSINGQPIDSYNAAFEVYKKVGSLTNVTVVIERGKKEMELEYEVN